MLHCKGYDDTSLFVPLAKRHVIGLSRLLIKEYGTADNLTRVLKRVSRLGLTVE